MNTIDMNTVDTTSIRAVHRRAAIAVVAAVVLSFAAIGVLGAQTNVTSGGFFARVGDYLTEVGEALGGE